MKRDLSKRVLGVEVGKDTVHKSLSVFEERALKWLERDLTKNIGVCLSMALILKYSGVVRRKKPVNPLIMDNFNSNICVKI